VHVRASQQNNFTYKQKHERFSLLLITIDFIGTHDFTLNLIYKTYIKHFIILFKLYTFTL